MSINAVSAPKFVQKPITKGADETRPGPSVRVNRFDPPSIRWRYSTQ
jgi:hypothetical protein